MALESLMKKKQIERCSALLETLREKDAEFATREAELERSIEEAATDEENAVVEEAVAKFGEEKDAHEAEKTRVQSELEKLESELAEIEERTNKVVEKKAPEERTKEVMIPMNTRTKFFDMTVQERDCFMAREDVKSFIERIRDMKGQTRAVTGAELFIPDVVLDLMRRETEKNSKLMPFVRLRRVGGTSRQNVTGAIPEAVWTEMKDALNEVNITFNQIEMDGYKMGAFVAIPNSVIEDSDLNLITEVIGIFGVSFAKTLDKTILFGSGKMPTGIVTRLAQTAQPENWGANAPAWTDLHTSNIKKFNIGSESGTTFFKDLMAALAIPKPVYSSEGLFWVMNRKTHIDIMAKALAFDAGAALVAGMNSTMPVVGGTVVEMDDDRIQDNCIIGGFGGNYLLVERAGGQFGYSDQPFYVQDMTAFKGTARYDGTPVSGEAFVVVNYNNVDPETAQSFAPDYANTDMNILTVTAAAGTATGDTVLTVSNSVAQSAQVYKYKVRADIRKLNVGDKLGSGWTALTSGTTQITAAAGVKIAVVELDANNRVVSVGDVAAVPKS